jgi:ABC-2 type transport system permease protein
MQSSRGANGVAVAAVGLAFVLRGFGDAAGTPSADGLSMTSAWPSWLSPIGWAQHVGAFTANDLTPLLLNLGLATGLLVAIFTLQSRRDLGASLLVGRPGRSDARASLSGSLALAWRLQWPTVIGWCVGAAVFGLFAGALADLVAQATNANPTFSDTLNRLVPTTNGSLDQVLIAAMFALVGIIAAGCAIQTIVRLRQEEAGGTAEAILATPTSRIRWFVDYLAVGAVSIVLVVLAGSVVSAAAALATGGDVSRIGDSFAAGAVQLPAAFVFLTLVSLVFTLLPGATVAVGWILYGGLTFIGEFGALIGLPEWLRNLSPFTHTPVPFGDSIDWSGGVWMLAVSLAAGALAVVVMRGRELHAG